VAWIERGNPVTQLPDSSEVIRALKSVPFRVVVEQFMTDTAALADIVLPAKGIFEQADVVGSYWHPYIQYKPAVAGTPGEVMPENAIYRQLADRMGIDAGGADKIPDNSEYDGWLTERISHTPGFSIGDLMKKPVIPGQAVEPACGSGVFNTPSGKIELWSDDAARLWKVSPLPTYDPPGDNGESGLPFRLMTPNIASRIHSQFGNLEVVRNLMEEPLWEMAVSDARRLGLKSGDSIRVFNSRGEVRGRIRVTSRVRSGSLIFPNGIWLAEGGGVNRLIAPAETDMGHGAAFHNTRADIEKITS